VKKILAIICLLGSIVAWSAEGSTSATPDWPANNIYGSLNEPLGNKQDGAFGIGYERAVGLHLAYGGEFGFYLQDFFPAFEFRNYGLSAYAKYYFSEHAFKGWYLGVSPQYFLMINNYEDTSPNADATDKSYLRFGIEEGYQWLFSKSVTLSFSISEMYGFALFDDTTSGNSDYDLRGPAIDIEFLKIGRAF
jgi:hypothetical protein